MRILQLIDTPCLIYSIVYSVPSLFQRGYKVAYLTFTQYMILMISRGLAREHAKKSTHKIAQASNKKCKREKQDKPMSFQLRRLWLIILRMFPKFSSQYLQNVSKIQCSFVEFPAKRQLAPHITTDFLNSKMRCQLLTDLEANSDFQVPCFSWILTIPALGMVNGLRLEYLEDRRSRNIKALNNRVS